jgi:hypothetical protein
MKHQVEQRNIQKSWKKFHTLASRESPSVTGCCRKHPPGNLPSGHAYTVLHTVEVNRGGHKYKLVKIRNPWAQERYTGPWSDNSAYWTPSTKKQAGWKKRNDGVFFMPFELFIDRLWSTGTAIYHNYNYEHMWRFKQTVKRKDFRIHNPVAQKFYVVLETQSPRLKP